MTPLYLQETHRISSGVAGTTFAAMVLAGAAAGPFLGSLSDRTGRKPVAFVALLGGSASALLLSVASTAPGLLPLMVVAGALLLGTRAVLMATALEMIGKQETAVLGFLLLASGGGEALGAYLVGLAGDIDLRWSMTLVAALALTAAALVGVHPFKAARHNAFDAP